MSVPLEPYPTESKTFSHALYITNIPRKIALECEKNHSNLNLKCKVLKLVIKLSKIEIVNET